MLGKSKLIATCTLSILISSCTFQFTPFNRITAGQFNCSDKSLVDTRDLITRSLVRYSDRPQTFEYFQELSAQIQRKCKPIDPEFYQSCFLNEAGQPALPSEEELEASAYLQILNANEAILDEEVLAQDYSEKSLKEAEDFAQKFKNQKVTDFKSRLKRLEKSTNKEDQKEKELLLGLVGKFSQNNSESTIQDIEKELGVDQNPLSKAAYEKLVTLTPEQKALVIGPIFELGINAVSFYEAETQVYFSEVKSTQILNDKIDCLRKLIPPTLNLAVQNPIQANVDIDNTTEVQYVDVDFSKIGLGIPVKQVFKLENKSLRDVQGITLDQSELGAFSVQLKNLQGSECLSIPSNSSCLLEVGITSEQAGLTTGKISIGHNTNVKHRQEIQLSATLVAPYLQFINLGGNAQVNLIDGKNGTVNFGQAYEDTQLTHTFEVRNPIGGTTISQINLQSQGSRDFQYQLTRNGGICSQIKSGEPCQLKVIFNANSLGHVNGQVELTSGQDTSLSHLLQISGEAVRIRRDWRFSSWSTTNASVYTDGTQKLFISFTQNFGNVLLTITNSGNIVAKNVRNQIIQGQVGTRTYFKISGCNSDLAAGASCILNIDFNASGYTSKAIQTALVLIEAQDYAGNAFPQLEANLDAEVDTSTPTACISELSALRPSWSVESLRSACQGAGATCVIAMAQKRPSWSASTLNEACYNSFDSCVPRLSDVHTSWSASSLASACQYSTNECAANLAPIRTNWSVSSLQTACYQADSACVVQFAQSNPNYSAESLNDLCRLK